MNLDGIVFHAGSPDTPLTALVVNGRCPTAMSLASDSGISAQNCAQNLSCCRYRSVSPSGRGTMVSLSPSVLPGKRLVRSPVLSPRSGAVPETKTSATTLLTWVAALLITEPPYECPTRTIGP